MNVRQGMFRLWIVVSGLWLLGDSFIWYPDLAAERAQLSALDKCGKLYQALPEGFVIDKPASEALASAPWLSDPIVRGQSAPGVPDTIPQPGAAPVTVTPLPALGAVGASQATSQQPIANPDDPDCAPSVGTIPLADFIAMHPSDRQQARQASANALRASATSAVVNGVAFPAGLLIFGLIMGWVIRGFRSR